MTELRMYEPEIVHVVDGTEGVFGIQEFHAEPPNELITYAAVVIRIGGLILEHLGWCELSRAQECVKAFWDSIGEEEQAILRAGSIEDVVRVSSVLEFERYLLEQTTDAAMTFLDD